MVNLHYRTAHPHFKQVLNTLFANAPADAAAKATAGEWIPRVDIKEENDRFVILADIPGIDPNDIEVNMDKGVLSIKGTRAADANVDGEKFTRVERVRGSFQRQFSLPDTANAEGITAVGKFGVLEISIPKNPLSAPRRISISH